MPKKVYKVLGSFFKVLACIYGAYCIFLGFVGMVFGLDIVGGAIEIDVRLFVSLMFFEGIAFCLPNYIIRRSLKTVLIYAGFSLLPCIIIAVFTSGPSILFLLLFCPLQLLASLSLLFSILADKTIVYDA